MRARLSTLVLTWVASLALSAGVAQALVVHDHGTDAGVTLLPGSAPDLSSLGITTGTTSSTCADPLAVPGLQLPATGALCWQGGPVLHGNETFAITWDPLRRDWATTRGYVEQFLSDVAAGSGTLTSPYAVIAQYGDGSGRAANDSVYGGACIDYGDLGGSACQIGDTGATISGTQYPSSACPASGVSYVGASDPTDPAKNALGNDVCLTDGSLQPELTAMISDLKSVGTFKSGHTPLLMMLTPPGVEVCLDSGARLCSANSSAPAQFCAYHSFLRIGGVEYPYVVQPWVPYTLPHTCDEPGLPALPDPPTDVELATDFGARLVGPLSAAQIAAITDPYLNGWEANTGEETDACAAEGVTLDTVTVGTANYVLPRAFNNGSTLESDPNAQPCLPEVALDPTFVAPSPVDPGDVVAFDGSATRSTLMVTNREFHWDFGDGSTATGPSVVHSYATGGAYTVTLTVTDRGGYQAAVSHQVQVSGAVTPPPSSPPPSQKQTTTDTAKPTGPFQVHLQLMPQALRTVLRKGLSLRVTSTRTANGLASVSIPRAAARKARLKTGRGRAVVVGRGTMSGIKPGTVTLHLKLSRPTAKKLAKLAHLQLTVRLSLVTADGKRLTVDAAGRY